MHSSSDIQSRSAIQGELERANALLQAGRIDEAIAAYEVLLQKAPTLADGWYNLAWLLQRSRRFKEALVAYQRSLSAGIESPEEVHLNRAVVLAEHLGRLDEAEEALSAALLVNPSYVPAWVNLGNLHEQRGDRDLAQAAYEKALALDPGQSLALSRLPDLRPALAATDPLLERIRQALARPDLTAAERADLGFGLGKALDRVGAYDEAFAAYAAANESSRVSAGRRVRYDRQRQEKLVDRLIAAFRQPSSKAGDANAAPCVFICGMFRSGSTLVEQILASHPEVVAGGEIDLLPALVHEHLADLQEPFVNPDISLVARIRDEYRDGIASLFPNSALVTDKRPDNFLHIGLIKQMFPGAKIVHTWRNALDNCLSIYFLHLSHSMPYALDLLDIAHWYRQYRRLMSHWKALYGEDIHDVSYDELVRDPRPVIERLLTYCELPWSERCLSFHQSRLVVKTPSAWQVRQPMYKRSSGRWRHYARHLDSLRIALEGFADEDEPR